MPNRPSSEPTRRSNLPVDDTAVLPARESKTGPIPAPAVPPGPPVPAANPTTPDQPKWGALISDLELLKELGRGRTGIVYKARQKSLDRLVAVKILPAERAKNPAVLASFAAEVRAAASVSHPNIVPVHLVGECPAGHYFVMNYVQGRSLHNVLDMRGSGKPLPLKWAVEVTVTVAEAIHHAHTRDIFHRDLKPTNIIIEHKTARPIIVDFGVAQRQEKLDASTRVLGSPGYMSPERASETVGSLGTPSDVYALGAILYRMLTGKLPFEAATALDTLLLVAGPTTAQPVRKLRPEVPAILNDICMKCLSKKPEDRYQSCAALAKELKASLKSITSPVAPPTMRRKPQPPARAVELQMERSGKKARLTKPVCVIGRDSDCDVVIRKADVSNRHCRILINTEGAIVEDLDSTTGTIVNGEPVTRRFLADGDRLEIASYSFVVKLDLRPKK